MRLFIAIEFPDFFLNAIAAVQRELRTKVQKGRFKQSGNFHLTLKFLGETSRVTAERLAEQLTIVGRNTEAFHLQMGQAGIFGAKPPIRVIWLGLAGELDRLHNLQQAVEAECAAFGFQREKRPYSPHITLAQEVMPLPSQDYLPQHVPDLSFSVTEFSIVLSEEKDRKRVYTPIHSFPLKQL
jgi:2'-5' RNA ligase